MAKYKKISTLDLSRFQKPCIPGNPPLVLRVAWYIVSAIIFQGAFSVFPSIAKSKILILFGAKIGVGVVIKPRVIIKSPWFLELGDHVWIGEQVWVDNHTTVKIGSNCCISQGAYIFTGNHDWTDPTFTFFCKPVTLGESVWVTAFQRIGPGSQVPSGVAVVSRSD